MRRTTGFNWTHYESNMTSIPLHQRDKEAPVMVQKLGQIHKQIENELFSAQAKTNGVTQEDAADLGLSIAQ